MSKNDEPTPIKSDPKSEEQKSTTQTSDDLDVEKLLSEFKNIGEPQVKTVKPEILKFTTENIEVVEPKQAKIVDSPAITNNPKSFIDSLDELIVQAEKELNQEKTNLKAPTESNKTKAELTQKELDKEIDEFFSTSVEQKPSDPNQGPYQRVNVSVDIASNDLKKAYKSGKPLTPEESKKITKQLFKATSKKRRANLLYSAIIDGKEDVVTAMETRMNKGYSKNRPKKFKKDALQEIRTAAENFIKTQEQKPNLEENKRVQEDNPSQKIDTNPIKSEEVIASKPIISTRQKSSTINEQKEPSLPPIEIDKDVADHLDKLEQLVKNAEANLSKTPEVNLNESKKINKIDIDREVNDLLGIQPTDDFDKSLSQVGQNPSNPNQPVNLKTSFTVKLEEVKAKEIITPVVQQSQAQVINPKEKNNKSQEELYVTDKDQQELNALFNENTGGQPIITNDTLNKKQNSPNMPEKDRQELNEMLNDTLQSQKQPQKEESTKETPEEFAQRILQDKTPSEKAYMLYAAVKNGKEDVAEALQNQLEKPGGFTDAEIGEILLEGYDPKSQKFSKILAAERLEELQNAIDFKDERAEQKFHKKEETTLDSISVGDAMEGSNAPGLDEITSAIRTEILEKQHALLLSEVANATPDEEEKTKISGMNPHQLREHLASPEGRDVATKVLNDKELHKKLNALETAGYKEVHTKFQSSFKNVEWAPGAENTRSTQIKNDQNELVADIKETTHNTKPINLTLADGNTKTVSSYRTIDFPKELETGKGPLHMSMALKDENGKNIPAKDEVCFTAHYDDNGKLTEVSSPQPVKFMGEGKDAVGYIERNGKVYTLPVTREKYQEMMKEVALNKGMGVDLSQEIEAKSVDKILTKDLPQKDNKEEKLKEMDSKLANLKKDDIREMLTEEIGKGNKEKVELIVEATKLAKNKGSLEALTEQDFKKAYHDGINKGATAPNKATQSKINLAAVSIVKEGNIDPKTHQILIARNARLLNQKLNKGMSH